MQCGKNKFPIVFNMSGWIKGLGAEILMELILRLTKYSGLNLALVQIGSEILNKTTLNDVNVKLIELARREYPPSLKNINLIRNAQ